MSLTQIGKLKIKFYISGKVSKTSFTNLCDIDIAFGVKYRDDYFVSTLSSGAQTSEFTNVTFAVFGTAKTSGIPIVGISFYQNTNYSNMALTYLNENGEFVSEQISSAAGGTTINKEIPIFRAEGSAGASSINLSTVAPNTAIEALVDGTMTEINNTPKTVNITDGNIVINVDSHSPKDKYTVQINNGENMLKLVDGSTQYTSFPASINVEANKTISAYGEPDKEITINYMNTGKPVITNT